MWAQLASAALGLWLMAAPSVLGYGDPARDNDRIVGPIAASFAFIAAWEATRSLRWAGVPLGAWLLVAPWLLGYGAVVPIANNTIVGILLIVLATVRGTVTQRFGGGWGALLGGNAPQRDSTR